MALAQKQPPLKIWAYRLSYITVALTALFFLFGLRFVMPSDPGQTVLSEGDGKTLVVVAPPLDGEQTIPELMRLVRDIYPRADFLSATYRNWWFSNSDPFELTDVLEEGIRRAHDQHHYDRIVVFGYSLGGVLARKALIWGHGFEEDRNERVRAGLARHGKHDWVEKVERFVSLAAPNRGWRSDKEHTPFYTAWASTVLEEIARVSGTGFLLRSVFSGAPFIANMRVQWINLAKARKDQMPLVVHLVGKRDELVSRDDSLDLNAAQGAIFKTLPAVNHREIARELFFESGDRTRLTEAGRAISEALSLKRDEFPPGWADPISRAKDEKITRIIYIMHGIRDEGDWTDIIENRILRSLGPAIDEVKIPSVRYNRFAMLPFLLYWDRQKNVRRFMDQYTEDLARYPNLEAVDYFGHSNGTYIVASALQQYPVLKVRNVLFAGSVVPSHYNWTDPISEARVRRVHNVVADTDWVVALFPQLFELISQNVLREEYSRVGLFDVGAAGFRGFREANENGDVRDIRFVAGSHGAAIDIAATSALAEQKLEAIAAFLAFGDEKKLSVFHMTTTRNNLLYILSNLTWALWLLIAACIVGLGWAAASRGRVTIGLYGIALILFFSTV